MVRKFYSILIFAITCSNLATAQIGNLVVTPPSPEASSLLKVSNYPDATYSGIPDISIPLFSYSGNSLQYNLDLSYSAQGFKINEESSAVGLGWVLNSTGVISREMMYKDDLGPLGFYNYDPQNFVKDGRDSSPDIFRFNIMGVTGKFILNYDPSSPGNYKVLIFNQVPFKIELIDSNFKITDDSGNIYMFDIKENTRKDFNEQGSELIASTSYISSWFLSSMKSPIGDEVTFQYNGIPEPNPQRKTISKYVTGSLTTYAGGGCFPYFYPGSASFTNLSIVTDQLLLSQVTFPNGSIQFQTSSRTDLDYDGTNLPLKYTRIIIQSNTSDFYKEIEFEQDYFYSGSGRADKLSKRLQLLGVYEKSNSRNVKYYSFSYNSLNLPDKDSESKDYWGFYNGQGSLFSNKEPSTSHVQANLLRSITYPTGAKIAYTFESNDYLNYSATTMDENPPNSPYGGKIGPGCRIAKIEHFDHLDQSLGYKEYKYLDGKRMSGSKYSQISFQIDPVCGVVQYESDLSQSNFSSSIGPGGYEIGYGQVTEIFSNQTDNGKKEYYYYNDAIISSTLQGVPHYVENRNGYLSKHIIYKRNGPGYLPVEERISAVTLTLNSIVTANIILPNYAGGAEFDTTYNVNSNWKYVESVTLNKYDGQGTVNESQLMKYYYDNAIHKQVSRASEGLSDSRKKWKFYQYPDDYSTGNTAINLLKSNHILNAIVEEVTGISNGSTYTITGGVSSEFSANGNGLKNGDFYLEIAAPIAQTSFKFSSRASGSLFPAGTVGNYSKDSRFESRMVYDIYTNNRISMFTKNTYDISSIKWGYGNEYPIVFAANAPLTSVAYTSFETGDNLNWTYSEVNTVSGVSKTGKKYYNLGAGAITKSGFGGSSTNVFKLTLWAKRTPSGPTSWNVLGSSIALSDTEWRLVQREISTDSFTISGSGVLIDEIRFHPFTSSLNTYTYFPLQGVSSYTDSKNRTYYYEYDSLGRLISIKNDDGYYTEVVEYEYMFSN